VVVAPVTLETFDPLVVQVEAAIVIVAVSGLVPPFCSGGSKVTVPVPEQVMLPVATVGALVVELVDVELLVVGDVEVDVEAVVGLWLLEQAGTKTKETTSTTPATAGDRFRSGNRIRGIVCSSLGSTRGFRHIRVDAGQAEPSAQRDLTGPDRRGGVADRRCRRSRCPHRAAARRGAQHRFGNDLLACCCSEGRISVSIVLRWVEDWGAGIRWVPLIGTWGIR